MPDKSAVSTVLLVEDNPITRRMLRVTLEGAGHRVLEAGDGATALALVKQSKPDVILQDLILPDIDGEELVRRVRSDPRGTDIPVICLTGFLSHLAEDAEFTAVLEKPIDPQRLVEIVRAATGAFPGVPLSATPPPRGPWKEQAERSVWQARRRAELAQRCAFMEMQLSILAGVAEALTEHRVLGHALEEVLSRCLDMAGISKGALFRWASGKMRLEHQIGFAQRESDAIAGLFEDHSALREGAVDRRAVGIPSKALDEDAARVILDAFDIGSALVVPIVSSQSLYGAVLLGSRSVDMTDESALAFARVLAAQLGQALALAEAFQRVAVSEENFRSVVGSMQDLVVTLDREQRVTGTYGRWTAEGRIRADEVMGKRVGEMFAPEADAPHEEANERALAGENVIYEWMFGTADGPTYMQTAASPLRAASGDVVGVVRVGRDVTKLHALQEQLILSDRMASVGLLAASVAHEINNPLAVAVGNLQLAREHLSRSAPGENDLRSEIADASEAIDRVTGIVRDLRIFCQPENDRPTNVELVPVLESALHLAVNEIRNRARVHKSYGLAPVVYCKEGRLGQAFLNLIVNAAQAMDESRAERNQLRISTLERPAGRAVVEIADTGPGIPKDAIPKLFSPFFSGKARGAGTGLGLAVAHRIVTDLGGTIEVESELGKGTLFRVVLPSSHVAQRTLPPPPLAAYPPHRGRILIIDDDPMVGATLMRLLAQSHDVAVHYDVRDALSAIGAGVRFDVILCDLMMPGRTGADFYRDLGRVAPEQRGRIIFMSGGAFTAAAQAFIEQTSNTWVQKPFDLDALAKLVNGRVGS